MCYASALSALERAKYQQLVTPSFITIKHILSRLKQRDESMLGEEQIGSKIAINRELCNKCGLCVSACPFTASTRLADSDILDVTPKTCISCGHCAAICPSGALTHADFPQGTLHSVNQNSLPSAEQTQELLRTRRSIRAFEDTPVERGLIEQMIEGARYAPTGHNTQSTECVIVEDRATLHKITELTADYLAKGLKQLRNPLIRGIMRVGARDLVSAALPMMSDIQIMVEGVRSGRDEILFGAPYLQVFHANRSTMFDDENAQLSLHNAALMCEGLGLGCFYAGSVSSTCRRDARIPKLLSIPDSHKVYAALAFGIPKYRFKQWMERSPPKVTWV
jgi:nitroreductase/NAD-dependent dihydropyrimidine dehydrogenase PreA subunit